MHNAYKVLKLLWKYTTSCGIQRRKYEVVDLLVSKYKAELSACNNADNTCLHLAALYGHTAVFELLA